MKINALPVGDALHVDGSEQIPFYKAGATRQLSLAQLTQLKQERNTNLDYLAQLAGVGLVLRNVDGTFSLIDQTISDAMLPVTSASTLLLAIAAMGPFSTATVRPTGGSVNRTLADLNAEVTDVRNFQAVGDGTADDRTAIQNAYNALPAAGGCLFLPPGQYKVGSALTFNRSIPFSIRGCGGAASVIAPSFAAGNVFDITNVINLDIQDIAVAPSVDRNLGTWIFNVDGTSAYQITFSRTKVVCSYGGVLKGVGHASYRIFENQWVSWGASHTDGDCVLRLQGTNEPIIQGNYFVNGNSNNVGNGADKGGWLTATAYALNDVVLQAGRYYRCAVVHSSGTFATDLAAGKWLSAGRFARAPVCWLSGSTTSVKLTGNVMNGGGPVRRFGIRSITNLGATFQITLDGNTNGKFFQPGEYLVLRDINVAAFNSIWRISVENHAGTYSIITVAATVTGSPTFLNQGEVAESLTACCIIDNDGDGTGSGASVNESNISGNLFEASVWEDYGSAALFFDGRRSNRYMTGWLLTGNYYDFGDNGIVLAGADAASTDSPTVSGISITGAIFESRTRWLLIDQASGVCATDLQGPAFVTTTTGDGLNTAGTGSSAVHVIASSGVGVSKSRGISIKGSNLGMCRLWSDGQQVTSGMDHAIVLDGTGIQDLIVSDNNLYGRSSTAGDLIQSANSALAATSRWKIRGNQCKQGAVPWAAGGLIPTVASATTIALPLGYDTVAISGNTTITTMNGGYVGREVCLLTAAAITFGPGATWARAAGFGAGAGTAVDYRFDGALWWNR